MPIARYGLGIGLLNSRAIGLRRLRRARVLPGQISGYARE